MSVAEPIRILFVEDVLAYMENAVRNVQEAGVRFESMRVETEAEFEAALLEFRPDLVVSAYSLPEFDGMRALKMSLEMDPMVSSTQASTSCRSPSRWPTWPRRSARCWLEIGRRRTWADGDRLNPRIVGVQDCAWE